MQPAECFLHGRLHNAYGFDVTAIAAVRRPALFGQLSQLAVLFAFAMTACDRGAAAAKEKPQSLRSQIELAMMFEAAKETVYQAKASRALSNIRVYDQTILTPVAEGLRVTATGPDPQLLLPPVCGGKQCILQVVIVSPVETAVQLYYSRRASPGFSADKSQTITARKGRNVIYFQLDQADLVEPLRFDPGSAIGDYVIESLETRVAVNHAD